MSPVVAVLGAGGFIGNRVVEMLHLRGDHVVRPIVRRPESLALAMRFQLDGKIADARDEAALAEAFAGCSHVVHAVAGPPEVIVDSVAPVYDAAAAAGVQRIIYLSSASVHGQSPAPGTDESTPLSSRQSLAYNNVKVEAERRLEQLRNGGSVEVVRLRPGIVHGPRSYWTGGFADEVLSGEAYLVEGGAGICNSIYVDNLVNAIHLSLTAPRADGEAFIVGDAETVTWADLCHPIVDALGCNWDDLIVSAPAASGWLQGYGLDSKQVLKRAATLLPARPRRSLRAAYATWRAPSLPGKLQGQKKPRVSEEKAALHLCRVRLPMDKARRDLGYEPIVDFESACRHAVSWLAFAGYPLQVADKCSTNEALQHLAPSNQRKPKHGA
ncbi:MAG: NAD-dependent epimerase/dehydratase family protein [Paracoccaceae bacterium]